MSDTTSGAWLHKAEPGHPCSRWRPWKHRWKVTGRFSMSAGPYFRCVTCGRGAFSPFFGERVSDDSGQEPR